MAQHSTCTMLCSQPCGVNVSDLQQGLHTLGSGGCDWDSFLSLFSQPSAGDHSSAHSLTSQHSATALVAHRVNQSINNQQPATSNQPVVSDTWAYAFLVNVTIFFSFAELAGMVVEAVGGVLSS